jgi:hypothetical protein
MTVPGPGARLVPKGFDVAPGVVLKLAAPAAAREEPEDALPPLDVSAVPGARVTVKRGLSGDGLALRVACVVAPSDRWAPGLEELVLGRATGLVTASLGVTVDRWEGGPILTSGARFEQRVAGRTGDRETAAIAHTLGFVGPDHDVVLCSIGCAMRAGDRDAGAGEGAPAAGTTAPASVTTSDPGPRDVQPRSPETLRVSCDEVLGASSIEGPLEGPPPPSMLVRTVLLAASRPYEAGAIVALASVVVVAVLLAKRPRVPGRRRSP